jgi:exodeoxyribonuclease VII small subunit
VTDDRTATAESPAIPADIASLTFDAALDDFQRTVAALEAGGQPLEEALALYERGVALHAHLDRLLTDAELRIRRLVERAGGGVDTGELRTEEPAG